MTIGELHELIVDAQNAERTMRDHPFVLEMSEAVEIARCLQQMREIIEKLDIFC